MRVRGVHICIKALKYFLISFTEEIKLLLVVSLLTHSHTHIYIKRHTVINYEIVFDQLKGTNKRIFCPYK